MSINTRQLAEEIIIPVLKTLDMYSHEAVGLLLGTAAHESLMGTYITQQQGPARGIFQMEPRTFKDVLEGYIVDRPELEKRFNKVINGSNILRNYDSFIYKPDDMVGNLYMATAMCRIFYWRIPAKIPKDLKGQAGYWKKYYNTELGLGTTELYLEHYRQYVGDYKWD